MSCRRIVSLFINPVYNLKEGNIVPGCCTEQKNKMRETERVLWFDAAVGGEFILFFSCFFIFIFC